MNKQMYLILLVSIVTILLAFCLKSAFAYEDDVDDSFGIEETKMEELNNENFEKAFENVEKNKRAEGLVEMKAEFLDGDILKISILAKEIQNPVLGISFNLKYPAEDLAFLRYEPGDFLERGGDPFYLVKNIEPKAIVIFGETLKQKDSFPLGEGKITDLYFQILRQSELQFKFQKGVISGMDSVRQDLKEIEWKDLNLNKNGGQMSDENFVSEKNLETSSFNFMNFGVGVLAGFGLLVAILMIVRKGRDRDRDLLKNS